MTDNTAMEKLLSELGFPAPDKGHAPVAIKPKPEPDKHRKYEGDF
jgi:hypothetical protein